jgi:hypothetical protein
MGELSSKFSRDDIETLLEAMNDWETLGGQEFHLMNIVKSTPMPPEYHEAYEMVSMIKEHYAKREKDIKESRITRQERAVFLKAKLMLVRRDMSVNQLFEMATEDAPVVPEKKTEVGCLEAVTFSQNDLQRAEFFIRDLGVWDHYQKFLSEKAEA